MTVHETSVTGLAEEAGSGRRVPLLLIVVAATVSLALILASLLWLHYGTTVFYEVIAAGLAACI